MDKNYVNYMNLFTMFALDDERDTNFISMTKIKTPNPNLTHFVVHLGYPYFSWCAVLSVKNKNTAIVIISDVHSKTGEQP